MLVKGATCCIANLSSPHLKVRVKSGGMSAWTYCWDYHPGILVPYGYPIFKYFSVDGLKLASSIIVSIIRATVRSLLHVHRGGYQTSAGLSGVALISTRRQIRVFSPGESHYILPVITMVSQRARFMRLTWGSSGSWRPQMGPMLAPWTLLSGVCRPVCNIMGHGLALGYRRVITPIVFFMGCDHSNMSCQRLIVVVRHGWVLTPHP